MKTENVKLKIMGRLCLVLLAMLVLCGVAACKRDTQRLPFLAPPDPAPPQEMSIGVKTDYSHLTSYVPPHNKYTRLHDGPLTELVPSEDYGMLLPYASAIAFPDGSLRESKYGLVTIDGVIVTDPVYDMVSSADGIYYSYYGAPPPSPHAYLLSVIVPGSQTQWGDETRQAACALDGSWVTPFDYVNVIFTENVAILMRSYESYDIDVYDYGGNLLYNMLDLEWTKRLTDQSWPGELVYSVSGGYGSVGMPDGTCAFINIKTGKARYTEYAMAHGFSGGYAPVAINTGSFGPVQQLWGVINSDFELVIPHKSIYPATFRHGRAILQLSEDTQCIVDERGRELFSVPKGFYADFNYTGPGFVIYDQANGTTEYYTIDLVPIRLPEMDKPPDYYNYVEFLDDGWYTTRTDDGVYVFSRDSEYYFPGVMGISHKAGDVFIYTESYGDASRMGVRTLDGREIVPPERYSNIVPVIESGEIKAFVLNTNNYLIFGGPGREYRQSTYRLVRLDGKTITQGRGVLTYYEAVGLYSVLGIDYFAWLDPGGNEIISIPNISNTFD